MSPVPEPADNHQSSIDELELGNHIVNVIVPGSSSEEEETYNENGGYEPLPQGPDNLEEEEIDYSSLSGILSALNTYGTNVVADDESEEIGNNLSSTTHDQLPKATVSDNTLKLLPESSSEAENVYAQEQAVIWNSTKKGNEIQIDEGKENEIKILMSKITLPSSAIPSWAKNMSEEEWKSQVSSKIFGCKNEKDDLS